VNTSRRAGFLLAVALSCATATCVHARECTAEQYKVDRLKMEIAFGAGLVRPDTLSSVFISEKLWNGLTYAQKVDFVESLSCAVAGVGKAVSEMTFRSDMTGKVIGEWSWGGLTVK